MRTIYTYLLLGLLMTGCSRWNVVEKEIKPTGGVTPGPGTVSAGAVTLVNPKPTVLGHTSATISFKAEKPTAVTEYGVILTTSASQVADVMAGRAAPLRRSATGAIPGDGTVNFDTKDLIENSLYFAVPYVKDGTGKETFSQSAVAFQTKFAPRNANWRQLTNLPTQRAYSYNPLFTINGKVYVGGAAQESPRAGYYYFQQLYEYDPETNIWARKKDFPGAGRAEPTVAVLNNKAYVMFGSAVAQAGYTPDAWEYDPATDNWRPLANPPLTAAGGFGDYNLQAGGIPAVHKNRVFSLFGRGTFNRDPAKTNVYTTLYALDPAANTWEVTFPLESQNIASDVVYAAARSGAFSFQSGDWVYFGGGLAVSSYNAAPANYGRYFNSRQIWAYNMGTRELKRVATLPSAFNDCSDPNATGGRMAGFAFLVGTKAYITDCSETQVFILDLTTGTLLPVTTLRSVIGANQRGTTGVGIGLGNKAYFGLRNADWWEFTPN